MHWLMRDRAARVCALLALLVALSGCGNWGATEWTDASLEAAYARAVADAAVADASEISRDLIAVTEDNTDLRWRGTAGDCEVLVVTWTSWTGYDASVGIDMTASRDIWVTAVPELTDFCRGNRVRGSAATLRMEQLLGLPPDTGKDRFVEMWVDPDDLFRPSPDPEVTDHEAELTFPGSPSFITVSPDHVAWFESQRATSYGEGGYPWTRLGYTYDWADPRDEVGLSEFVVRTGATVEPASVTPTLAYCEEGSR